MILITLIALTPLFKNLPIAALGVVDAAREFQPADERARQQVVKLLEELEAEDE